MKEGRKGGKSRKENEKKERKKEKEVTVIAEGVLVTCNL